MSTLQGSHVATFAYYDSQMSADDTAARCQANGVRYQPMVLTVQGGFESHAEEVLTRVYTAASQIIGEPASQIKADSVEIISASFG